MNLLTCPRTNLQQNSGVEFLAFHHRLCAASLGVVLLVLFNTAVVRRREPDSNLANAIVLEVRLLPPHRWIAAVTAVSVAQALCLTK